MTGCAFVIREGTESLTFLVKAVRVAKPVSCRLIEVVTFKLWELFLSQMTINALLKAVTVLAIMCHLFTALTSVVNRNNVIVICFIAAPVCKWLLGRRVNALVTTRFTTSNLILMERNLLTNIFSHSFVSDGNHTGVQMHVSRGEVALTASAANTNVSGIAVAQNRLVSLFI